jgi:hypothetical protein
MASPLGIGIPANWENGVLHPTNQGIQRLTDKVEFQGSRCTVGGPLQKADLAKIMADFPSTFKGSQVHSLALCLASQAMENSGLADLEDRTKYSEGYRRKTGCIIAN